MWGHQKGIRNQESTLWNERGVEGTQDRKWKVERNVMSEQMIPSEDNRREERAGPKEIQYAYA